MPPPLVTVTFTWFCCSGTASPPTAPPGFTIQMSGLTQNGSAAGSGSVPSSAGWVRM